MRNIIFTTLLTSSVFSALFIGDRDARRIAIVLIIASVATWLIPLSAMERFARVSWSLFAIDAATWLALLGIVACSDKHWPAWIAAMQGMTVLSHLAGLGPHISRWVYFRGTVSWAWPIVILLQIAVLIEYPPVRRRLALWSRGWSAR